MTQVSDDSGMHGLAGLSPDVFRRLADASADGIGMARLDSRIIYANATLLRLLGLSDASALTEHSFFDYYPPDEAARLRDEIIPQVQAAGEWTGELSLVSGSGTSWHTIQNIFLIRDEHGAPAAYANVITDITERVRATESLRVSQAAIDSSINAIAMSSLEGKLTYVNQAFVDLWQLDSPAEALGRSPLDFWAQPQQAQAVVEALQQEGRWQGELEARRRDGSTVELELSAHMVHDSSGRPACMMSWFVDISAHAHMQQDLLRSQAFLTSIIQHIPAVVFIKRASDLRFELFNRAGEKLLGHEQAEVLGKTDHDLFPPKQADFFVATDREVLASGVPLDIAEEPVQARNGEIRIMHTRKSGIYNAAGKPTHLLGIAVDITDRKHAEALLKQQRDFATGLVDTAPVIILVLDPDGLIEYVNPYFERLSGYRLEDLKGREWFDSCLPSRDRDRIRELFHQATHDTLKPGNVNPIVTRDGKERDIEWSNQALHDADGKLVSLLAIGLDVTERQQNEERTHISEIRLNEAQRIAKVGSWELDLESDTLIWTDEIFTLFEIDKTRFDASYEAFLDCIHPEDRDIVNAAYVQSLSDHKPYVITHRLRMADGRIKWVEERCETEFDADGKPLRSHGTVQDITERWKLEEALIKLNMELEQRVMERTAEMEAQNIRNASIINAAMDGFFVADLTGRMIDVNDIYCSMLGYDRAEFLALTIPDVEGNEHPEDVAAHIETILEMGEDRFDTRHRRKDGSLIEVEVNVTLLDLGNERLFYAFVHDISPRKEAESALIRARDEAERANLAKTEFLSRMSHELRTPMNAILGFAQLLEAEPLEEEQTGSVHEILHAGRHLLEMINEVLDLSRIESGHLDIQIEAVTCQPITESCVATIRPLAAQHDITVMTDLACGCAVAADPLRLRQVLINLLSNAVKYNREGGTIEVNCRFTDDDHIRIAVRDSGIGIAAEAMPRLFHPFERLETTYSGIEGAGIGLALSKRLVEAMDGRIGADSTHGVGSTFWVELPQAPAPLEMTGESGTGLPHAEAGAKQHTLLCVEDNPANLRLLHRILGRREDLRLIDTHTGELCIDLARKQHPDLILLDISLPGMDGFDTLRYLRADARTRDIPVVAISANAMQRDIDRGIAEGFADYLTKPVDISRLLGILDRYLPEKTKSEA